MKHDILIIGSGAFGLTAAIELRRRDWSVLLLDAAAPPHPDASSTDVSKAVRLDYGSDLFYTEFAEAALSGWEEWNQTAAPLFHRDGWLLLSNAMQPGGFEYESHALLEQRNHRLERVDSSQLAARYPAWNSSRYPDGYFNPEDGWAESGAVVRKLAAEATAMGVRLRTNTRVSELTCAGSRVTGVCTADGEHLESDEVLVTAGAWTPLLVPWLADRMWPTAQTVLHFQPEHPEQFRAEVFPPWAADIANSGWYGFPATDKGEVKVGHHASGQRISPDGPRQVPDGEEERFREFLRESIPSLCHAPLAVSRLCFYCDTFDGDFWIDRDPDHSGLTVAAGGSGHGFKFAPLLGSVIADAVESKQNRYLPRFAWRVRGADRQEGARAEG